MQVIAATTCKQSFLANQVAQRENDLYKLRAMNLSNRWPNTKATLYVLYVTYLFDAIQGSNDQREQQQRLTLCRKSLALASTRTNHQKSFIMEEMHYTMVLCDRPSTMPNASVNFSNRAIIHFICDLLVLLITCICRGREITAISRVAK
jgi:hypothetical protein